MSNLLVAPNRFVGLHAHTTFSNFDGLGYPDQHIDFCLSNQLDSWAITDHGNGNGIAHAHAHAKKLKSKGQKYRQIYGVEFYMVPDLNEWQKAYNVSKGITEDSSAENDEDDGTSRLVVEDADDTRTMQVESINRRYHVVVVAKNRAGLSNLFTLVKRSFKEGFYRFPRIDFRMLKEHSEGLLVSTACCGGLPSGIIYREFADHRFNELSPNLITDSSQINKIMSNLKNMTDRFVDSVGLENFFLEVQFNKLGAQDLTNLCLLKLHDETGIPLLATADSHYPGPDLWQSREIYRQLQPGRISRDGEPPKIPEKDELKAELYPKNAEQMWESFLERRKEFDFYHGYEDKIRQSIELGYDLAWDVCDEIWFDDKAKLPSFKTGDSSAFNKLLKIVKDALVDEKLHDKKEYVERAKFELSDIQHLGFEDYFLTLQKVFKVAENRTLPGAGRGSGAGSLVNYLLGITHVDPLKYDLLWERFLGRHRSGWPDIDTDVGDREQLIIAAREIFGEESVVPVSNFNTLKLKSLVKDISKLYGIPYDEVNAVTGPLEREVAEKSRDPNMEKSMFVLKHEDCMEHSPRYREFMEKYPQVESQVRSLFMMVRSCGRHAGGVLICPNLEQHMPLISVKGELQTPWTEGVNIRNLEENGFLKFDFLGIKQMQMVEDCIRRIVEREKGKVSDFSEIKDFYDKYLNCRYVEPNDAQVFKHVYQEGRWPGIFQFTSDGARRFCIEAQPENIEDLSAITAIYRPGPLKANVHKKYVEAKRNRDSIVYDHPVIEEVLGATFGFVVYQEQFMILAQKLAGFTPGESDKMRKTLVKKDLTSLGKKSDEKVALEKKFIDGCMNISGMSYEKSKKLFDTIAFFSLYGFNRSHAISYAIVSYYGAWLATHYEKDWLATCLQSDNAAAEKLAVVMSEIKQIGYQIAPSDINYSGTTWNWSDDLEAFVPPLSSLKGIGDTAMEEIVEGRPYKNLNQLLFDEDGKWYHKKMNRRAFEALICMEAFSSLEEMKNGTISNHHQLYQIIIDNYGSLRKGKYGMSARKAIKYEIDPILDRLLEETKDVEDWSRSEKVFMQAKVSGSAPHHLVFPPDIMNKIHKVKISPISSLDPGKQGVHWFVIIDAEKKSSKNGKTFWRIRVQDDSSYNCWIRVWGDSKAIQPYSIWMADLKYDQSWGISTNISRMKLIESGSSENSES